MPKGPTRLVHLLVLRELLDHPNARLREVAEALGVTPQAVSLHLRRLADRSWVTGVGRKRSVTPQGFQALHDGLRTFHATVLTALSSLPAIDRTSALARTRIARGEPVGLSMEDGELVARAGAASPSRGRALEDANVGQDVLIGDLAGVVDLVPGGLWVVPVPGPSEGGSRALDATRLRDQLTRRKVMPQRVGAEGLAARLVARRMGWAVDFEFATARASFNAAELGVDVCLLVSRERMGDVEATLEALNAATLRRVPFQIIEAPSSAFLAGQGPSTR